MDAQEKPTAWPSFPIGVTIEPPCYLLNKARASGGVIALEWTRPDGTSGCLARPLRFPAPERPPD